MPFRKAFLLSGLATMAFAFSGLVAAWLRTRNVTSSLVSTLRMVDSRFAALALACLTFQRPNEPATARTIASATMEIFLFDLDIITSSRSSTKSETWRQIALPWARQPSLLFVQSQFHLSGR